MYPPEQGKGGERHFLVKLGEKGAVITFNSHFIHGGGE